MDFTDTLLLSPATGGIQASSPKGKERIEWDDLSTSMRGVIESEMTPPQFFRHQAHMRDAICIDVDEDFDFDPTQYGCQATSSDYDSSMIGRAALNGDFSVSESDILLKADEAFARQLQDEDEVLHEAEKRKRQEEEDRLLQQFLRSEGLVQQEVVDVEMIDNDALDEGDVKCELCGATGGLHCLELCNHFVCGHCIRNQVITKIVESNVSHATVPCPKMGCKCVLSVQDIQAAIPKEEYERILKEELDAAVKGGSFARCPGCSVVVAVETNNPQCTHSKINGMFLVDGHHLTPETYSHWQKFRMRCVSCSVEFCASCTSTPYHMGKTCEQYKIYQVSGKCRFCDSVLSQQESKKGVQSVCSDPTCAERAAAVCTKVHPCGHPCCGVKGEKPCLPCLHEECHVIKGLPSACDFCAICYSEGLSAAPCIKLLCGHVFHLHCVEMKIKNKWTGARITFGFMSCPQCKEPIVHQKLEQLVKEIVRLRDDVKRRSLLRMQNEAWDQAPEIISDTSSPYYKKPHVWAEVKLCYYQCFKCKKAYFGGMRQCEIQAEGEDIFKPENLVCAGCVPGEVNSCKTHGVEFIEYKCKFCCRVASFFCWGTTHFCAECHRKQEKGEYLTRKKIEELPQCDGGPKCPLKVKHSPTGTEFALGCALCRRLQAAEDDAAKG